MTNYIFFFGFLVCEKRYKKCPKISIYFLEYDFDEFFFSILQADKQEAGPSGIKEEKKGAADEKMEEDDLLDDGLLPSDLFGDTDIFKLMNANEGDVDIDDAALDDAEKEDGENKNPAEDEDSKASNDLADALGLSNFNLDSKGIMYYILI